MRWFFLVLLILPAQASASLSPYLQQLTTQLKVKSCHGTHLSVRGRRGEMNSLRSGLAMAWGSFLSNFPPEQFLFQSQERINRLGALFEARSPADLVIRKDDLKLIRILLKTNLEAPRSRQHLADLNIPTVQGRTKIPITTIELLRSFKRRAIELEPILDAIERNHLEFDQFDSPSWVYNPFGSKAEKIWNEVKAILDSRERDLYGVSTELELHLMYAAALRRYLKAYLEGRMPVYTELAYAYQQLHRFDQHSGSNHLGDITLSLFRKTLELVREKQKNPIHEGQTRRSGHLESFLGTIFQEAFWANASLKEILLEMTKFHRQGLGPALIPAVQGILRLRVETVDLAADEAVQKYFKTAEAIAPTSVEILVLAVVEAQLREAMSFEAVFDSLPSAHSNVKRIINGFFDRAAGTLDFADQMQLEDARSFTRQLNFRELAQEIRRFRYQSGDVSGPEGDEVYQVIFLMVTGALDLPDGSSFLSLRHLN